MHNPECITQLGKKQLSSRRGRSSVADRGQTATWGEAGAEAGEVAAQVAQADGQLVQGDATGVSCCHGICKAVSLIHNDHAALQLES